jgi:hypothetical protein
MSDVEKSMNTENVPGGAKTPRITEYLDQQAHAAVAQASSSLSLITGLPAFLDWAGHLAVSPGKRLELAQLAIEDRSPSARETA